jgi:glycosyltransferase involved in cell wall biosynthesis
MAKADMVLANSEYLRQIAERYNPKSYFIGQGCDLSLFTECKSNSKPADICDIQGPIIGYIGTLVTLRLEIDIIRYIALTRPDWSIVLVGPEDEGFQKSDLHDIKNIHFLGSKHESELAVYLNAFDVAINPQLQSELTIGNYPRKIDEYLAMGKPTVATDTIAMQYFKDYVSLVKDNPGWITAIESEITNNTPENEKARIAFATNHTWTNNVNEIYKCIENHSF